MGVISEQAAGRIHSALPILFVMRESQISNDRAFWICRRSVCASTSGMLRENPNNPYLRLMGLTYLPPDYAKDNAASLEI
jgi:hypothetical protein